MTKSSAISRKTGWDCIYFETEYAESRSGLEQLVLADYIRKDFASYQEMTKHQSAIRCPPYFETILEVHKETGLSVPIAVLSGSGDQPASVRAELKRCA